MLLGTLGTSLLGNLLTGKGVIATSQGSNKSTRQELVMIILHKIIKWIFNTIPSFN